jgi:hypothetical protein
MYTSVDIGTHVINVSKNVLHLEFLKVESIGNTKGSLGK